MHHQFQSSHRKFLFFLDLRAETIFISVPESELKVLKISND